MNGGQNSNNEFLLDGAPNNANQGGNNIAYVPPAEAVQEMKISTNSYDAQYGRTAGGVVNMSLKSGTNSFHGVVYDFMRRKALAANSFLLNSRNAAQDRSVHRSVRVQRRRPDLQEQDVLPVHRREVPGRHARAAVQHDADGGDEERRLQRSRGRAGTPDPIYDPNTGRDVNGVWTRDPFPGNSIPADRINATARAIMQYYPDPNGTTAGVAPWQNEPGLGRALQQGPVLELGREGRPQLRRERPGLLPLGRERAERDRQQGQRHPQRPGPGRPASALARQPRARRRLGAHLRRRDRVQPARQLHLLPGVELFRGLAVGFDATEFWPASLVNQMPSQALGGIFPRDRGRQFASLSRGSSPNRNRNYSIQPNVSLTRGAHNIRSGLDMRWTNVFNENYNNSGGHVRSTATSRAAP